MVTLIKSRIEQRKLAKTNQRKKRRNIIFQFLIVFALAFCIFLFETGRLSLKQSNNNVEQVQKLAKKINKKIVTSSTTAQTGVENSPSEPIVRPMTTKRQDFDDDYIELGTIIIPKISLDLMIIKGAGSTEQSSYEKLFYACTDKNDVVLGQDNFVLASHSSQYDQSIGFSSLLKYKDGTLDSHRRLDISQLLIEVGDLITIYQKSDQRYYLFKISSIDGDESNNHQLVTDKMADIEGKPQLTIYACSTVGSNDDGRIVIQANFVTSSTS